MLKNYLKTMRNLYINKYLCVFIANSKFNNSCHFSSTDNTTKLRLGVMVKCMIA